MMDVAPHSPPTPPRRSLVVGIEGVHCTGKTTLLDALLRVLGEDAAVIKRPIPGGDAEKFLRWTAEDIAQHDMEASVHGLPAYLDDLNMYLASDCAESIRLARTSPKPIRFLSRHWISNAANQHKDWRKQAQYQRDLWGEPDLWIICDAPWEVVEWRLHQRAEANPNRTPCPGSDLDHTTPPDVIAAHLVRYQWIARHVLRAPVITVTPDRVSIGAQHVAHLRTTEAAAHYIAAHIRYLQENP